jgi:hypothetical protein
MLSISLSAQTKIIPLPEVNKTELILWADQDQFYVVDGTSVLIYSLKDFKLIKKFGKTGEGPQEFANNQQFRVWLDVNGDNLLVNSFGKLSWFTKKGVYIKEAKLPNPFVLWIQKFGKRYLAMGFPQGGKVRYRTLNLYDDKFNVVKELVKMEENFQPGKGFNVLNTTPIHFVDGDKLYVAWTKDFLIQVFDLEGKELYTITHKLEKRKVTGQEKKDFTKFLETYPATKDYIEYLKPILFPEYWPMIGGLNVENNKVYVTTSKKLDEEGKFQLLIFDLKGKLLKDTIIPLIMDTPVIPYPNTFKHNKVYQLVENEEEENWEIHITEIK